MKPWVKQLWKVPVFCILAGIVATYATIYIGGRFFTVLLDGSVSIDGVRVLLWHCFVLVATLGLGHAWVFRRMERLEIFCSSLLWSGVLLIITILQNIWGETPAMMAVSLRIYPIWEWSSFAPGLVYRLTGSIWLGAYADCLMPLIFPLLGKKKE